MLDQANHYGCVNQESVSCMDSIGAKFIVDAADGSGGETENEHKAVSSKPNVCKSQPAVVHFVQHVISM